MRQTMREVTEFYLVSSSKRKVAIASFPSVSDAFDLYILLRLRGVSCGYRNVQVFA